MATVDSFGKERNHLVNRRYCLYFLALFIGIILTIIAILIPVIVIRAVDSARAAKYRAEEAVSTYEWKKVFDDILLTGYSQVYVLEGFVFSNLSSIPRLDETPQERVAGQYYSRFPSFVDSLLTPSLELQLLALCPGGVYNQMSPFYEALFEKEVFSDLNYFHSVIENLSTLVVGPEKSLRDDWILIFLSPVFNTTLLSEEKIDNFWGFVTAWVSISGSIARSQLPKTMKEQGMSYLLYSIVNGEYTVIDTSLPGVVSEEDVRHFEDSSTTLKSSEKGFNLTFVVAKENQDVILSPSLLLLLIVVIATIGVIFTAVSIGIIAACTRTSNAMDHAPKSPPFAMLIIGPQQGEDLWITASDQMYDITEKLAHVLDKKTKEYHAYQIPQLQPYTTTYIFRKVEDAAKMAFSVIEELHENPIDKQLLSLTDGSRGLPISYALHWCKSGIVSLDPSSKSERLRYEGQEILHGVRMWRKAPPSVLVISDSTKIHVGFNLRVQFFCPAENRSNEGEEELYFVFDPSRPVLQEAKSKAEKEPKSAIYKGTDYPFSADPFIYHFSHSKKDDRSYFQDGCGTGTPLNETSRRRDDSAVDLEDTGASRRKRSSNNDRGGKLIPHGEGFIGGSGEEMEAFVKALLEPQIPSSLLSALRTAFENQWLTVGITFDSVKLMVYYFYSCFKLFFKPLAAPQRQNIFTRLVTAFGVPQDGLLEHLAAHCTVRFIQQQQETKSFYSNSHL